MNKFQKLKRRSGAPLLGLAKFVYCHGFNPTDPGDTVMHVSSVNVRVKK